MIDTAAALNNRMPEKLHRQLIAAAVNMLIHEHENDVHRLLDELPVVSEVSALCNQGEAFNAQLLLVLMELIDVFLWRSFLSHRLRPLETSEQRAEHNTALYPLVRRA